MIGLLERVAYAIGWVWYRIDVAAYTVRESYAQGMRGDPRR